MGLSEMWLGMAMVCSNCKERGVSASGDPKESKCTNRSSPRFGEQVGYQGSGCDEFQYPDRQSREYKDTTRPSQLD